MKKTVYRLRYYVVPVTVLLILQFHNLTIKAQSSEEILIAAEIMPSFPGGTTALMNTIYKNLEYPQDARDKGIEGKVILRFVVTKEGNVIQPSIVKGLYPSIDRAVLEVAPKIPRFEPARNGGKPVNVWYSIPISFKLLK